MAIYEILVRGNPDGTISGSHAIDYHLAGKDANGDDIWATTSARPLQLSDLQSLFGEQFAAAIVKTSEQERRISELESAVNAMASERDALRAQVRELRGTPQFTARKLLDVLAASAEDMQRISVATAESPNAMTLYQRLLTRSDGEPVVVDSPVFLAALGALRAAIGDDVRVDEIFRAVNIDVTANPIAYIDPSAV